jgi:tetratricopeptide (TPR) repeat protein
MDKTKKITAFAAGLCVALNCVLAALDADGALQTKPLSVTDEFRAAVTELEIPGAGAAEKHDAYARLASLLYLSGDVERAAAAWENAAYADPEKRDDAALVESAACYVSMGDWDKADSVVKLLLLTSRDDKNIAARAVFLGGLIEAVHKGSPATLCAIADNPAYLPFRPAIYYTLWRVAGSSEYRAKLLKEFPDSPEAHSAADGPKLVSALQTAYWLLFPGRESVDAAPSGAKPDTGQPDPPAPPAKHAPAQVVIPATAKTARSLQAGLYKEKQNAALQAERLKADGFNAALAPRTVDGSSYWAVSVSIPEGATMKNTIARLKEHGFDAFPASTQAN